MVLIAVICSRNCDIYDSEFFVFEIKHWKKFRLYNTFILNV